jgi:tetratricopeptide (TPR) repeat protein
VTKTLKPKKYQKKIITPESRLGEVIVDCLIAELHNIRQKYEELDMRDNYISIKPHIPDGETCVDASGLRKQILVGSPSLPHLQLGDSNIIGSIGEVSTTTPIATKISLDSLMLLIKRLRLFNQKSRIITGSIQKQGDNLRIIARMEQGKHTRAWEVTSDTKNKNIPDLVQKLAYFIARDLSKQQVSYTSFKNLINLLELYAKFIHGESEKELQEEFNELWKKSPKEEPDKLKKDFYRLKEESSMKMLDELWRKCESFAECEPAYEGIFGLLYNIGVVLLEKNDYEKAEVVFRRAISLEPYIINRIFDAKVAYEDVNWSKEFWKNAFKEYRSRSHFWVYFAYPLRSRLMKLSLNKETRNEYRRISMWAKGLSPTLMALGQTLERNKLDKSSDKNSILDRFVDLSQAKEAYIRADLRDRKDASALAHLSSLMIENVNTFENHDQLKEGIIEEAQEILYKAISKPENRCLAFNRLGNLYHDQGDYKLAIHYYEKAIIDRCNFVVAYRNLGIAFCETMDFVNSLKRFTEGMNLLSDDAIFQTDFCQNKWHAWLHNGKGWTYLSQYLSQYIYTLHRETSEDSLLSLAEKNFHEAISISRGKMYVSFFNLGNVYALQGKTNDAKNYWKLGIDALKKDKDTILGKLLCYIYRSSYFQFSREMNTENLKEFIRTSHPPIRILNAILQDLLILKECQTSIQPNHIDIDHTIQFIEDYLPTLYVGVSYIWKHQMQKAIDIFQRKLPQLYFESKEPLYTWFRSYLWILLYCGLIRIFSDRKNPDELDIDIPEVFESFKRRLQNEESLEVAIKSFNSRAQEQDLELGELDPKIIGTYKLEDLKELIEKALIRFGEKIKNQDSSRELYREILNDICRKYKILRQGVGNINESDYENYEKNLALIFQPIERVYEALENRIKHDSKMNKSRLS